MLMTRAVLRRHSRVRWVLGQVLLVARRASSSTSGSAASPTPPGRSPIRHAHDIVGPRAAGWGFDVELAVQARVVAHDCA